MIFVSHARRALEETVYYTVSPSGACTVTDYLDDGRAGDRSIIRAVY